MTLRGIVDFQDNVSRSLDDHDRSAGMSARKVGAVLGVLLAGLLLGQGQAVPHVDRLACTNGRVCDIDKDHMDFFLLGDTGGNQPEEG